MNNQAVDMAVECWGGQAPEWVLAMARAIDAEGGAMPRAQKLVAERIGYSNAVVHEVLRNRYRGDHVKVALRVAQCLASESADCPVLGRIAHVECHAHQARKDPGSTPLKVQLFRACRGGCPHSFIVQKEARHA